MIYPFTFSTTTPTTTIPSTTTATTTTPRQASHLSDAYTTSYGQVINNKVCCVVILPHTCCMNMIGLLCMMHVLRNMS
ncbi:hypothetical protein K492DRAFT_177608 [Lichtheimia hyalospora FSU 10163]|nr:hypothetical protein K492DRAFT_177608 [Lichtheimia hyalospora FSU 10163]